MVFMLVLSLIMGSLSAIPATANPANEGGKYYKGLRVLSEKTETTESGTVKTVRLAGGKEELLKLIEQTEKKEKGLSATNPSLNSSSTNIQPFNIWGDFKGHVAKCFTNSGQHKCLNGNINANLNWGGATGFTVDGSLAAVMVKTDSKGTYSNQQVKPRIEVTVYGLVGSSEIITATHNFDPGFVDDTAAVYNFDETKYGIVAYINIRAGGDFKYKYNNVSYSYTHWATITED